MEKKNNNGMLVGILIGIIIMLVVVGGLFATNIISFKTDRINSNQQNNETEKIAGIYEFYEFAEPNQNMVYNLQINEDNTVILNIDGFQTLKKMKAAVEFKNNKYNVVYKENLSDVKEPLYKEGDILFVLYQENSTLYTSWNKLQPMLEINKNDGIYFTLKNNNEETKEMTKEDATSVLKKAADRIGNVSNGYPYCGENMKYDEVDVILDEHNLSTHTASKDYISLNNMKDDLKKYMSEELINKYINDSYYVEKDKKLYCTTPHKGTDLYDKNNSSYTVETFTNDEIIAKGIVATYSEHADEYRNNVVIEMKRKGADWQITKYVIQK